MNLPVQSFGWMTNLSLLSTNILSSKKNYRFEGNSAYAFNENFYGKAGINFSNTIGSYNIPTDFGGSYNISPDFGLGVQAGIGIQLSNNIGAEFNFVVMTQSISLNSTQSIRLVESGLEFGAHVTF